MRKARCSCRSPCMRPSLSGDPIVQSFKGEDAQLARRLRNHLVASRSMQTKSERTVRRIDQARPSSLCASRCSQLPRPTPFWVVRQTAQTISSETLPDLKLAVAENDSRSVSRMLDIMCGCTLSRRPRALCTRRLLHAIRPFAWPLCARTVGVLVGKRGSRTSRARCRLPRRGTPRCARRWHGPRARSGCSAVMLCSCDVPLQSCPAYPALHTLPCIPWLPLHSAICAVRVRCQRSCLRMYPRHRVVFVLPLLALWVEAHGAAAWVAFACAASHRDERNHRGRVQHAGGTPNAAPCRDDS